MTPLRHRMIPDLRIRNYSPETIDTYVRRVAALAQYFGKSPELLGPPHIRQYQVHLIEEAHASWPVFNQTVCALRFVYKKTLHKPWLIEHIPFPRQPKKLPVVLSTKEVGRVLGSVRILKHRTVLETIYATGLRISEASNPRHSSQRLQPSGRATPVPSQEAQPAAETAG